MLRSLRVRAGSTRGAVRVAWPVHAPEVGPKPSAWGEAQEMAWALPLPPQSHHCHPCLRHRHVGAHHLPVALQPRPARQALLGLRRRQALGARAPLFRRARRPAAARQRQAVVLDHHHQAAAVRHQPDQVLRGSPRRSHPLRVPKQKGTFSLDTERLEWTHHGDWLLPFRGQAYYDNELDAWVGLCCHDDGAGYVCCCDVPPVAAEFTSQPSWKLGKEKLFDTKSALHLGATLVYMGSSKFCLVESMARKDEEHIRIERHDFLPPRRVLCMTTFGLKYDKAGELIATTQRARSCRKYTAANDLRDPQWNPVAFWI